MLDSIYAYVPDWAVDWVPGSGDYQQRQGIKKLAVIGGGLAAAYFLLKRK